MSDTIETKQEQQENIQKPRKKRTVVIIALIVLVFFAIFLTVAYFWVADYYKTHFLPGTTLNQIVCDNLKAEEVADLLESQSLTYRLTVTGQKKEEIGSLTAEDVGLKIVDTLDDVQHILESQNHLGWLASYLGKGQYDHEVSYATEFSREKVLECLAEWPVLDEAKMEPPQNAYISEYLPEQKGYEIIPEIQGNTLDVDAVEELTLLAVENGDTELHLEELGCYLQPEVTSKDAELNDRCDRLNQLTSAQITYDWNGTEVVLDGDTIHEWILGEDELVGVNGTGKGEILLDQDAVAEFVAEQAKQYDTYGKNRKFTTTLGETITVLNGGYGWKTDREKEVEELLALINEGSIADREPVYRVKAAKKGTDDIGNSYVEIDLTHQHLYLYWKGELVLETDFVSGDMSKGNVTPGGLYRLTYKTRDAVLRGADYETPVKYWMPFNGNIGMHDATWRNAFGGDIFLTNGSHGCVNLPLDKAEAIYAYVSTGFPIICYYY